MIQNSVRRIIQMVQVRLGVVPKDENHQPKKLHFAFSFRPIYYFMRSFGRMPFTVIYDSNGAAQETRVTPVDIIWFLIALSLYLLAINGDQMWENTYKIWSSTEMFILTNKIWTYLEVILCMFCVIMDLCNRFKLIEIVKNFGIFDKEVSQRFFDISFFLIISMVFVSCNCRWRSLESLLTTRKAIGGLFCIAQHHF